ncbi:hypothetical protein ACIP93_26875 [Streptomyces sp. NPDC088745]|uniref:hypothetical protein n=1 Tax=Streptomyces sp. NPDC088745 TaxID=3365884 RepID=UPI003811834A
MRSLFGARGSRNRASFGRGLPVGGDGVPVGADARGRLLLLGSHRSVPYDVVLIGGVWTAQVLALRAARGGVRVVVETGRAGLWAGVAEAAGAEVCGVGRVPAAGADEGCPVLVVRDCGMRPPRGRVAPAPWQSVLTLLPYLSPVAPGLVRNAALVGVQRVSPQEAEHLGRLLALSPTERGTLPGLADGVTLWCADGPERHWVTTAPDPSESALLGPPRRMDPAGDRAPADNGAIPLPSIGHHGLGNGAREGDG